MRDVNITLDVATGHVMSTLPNTPPASLDVMFCFGPT